jgi:hypothetical protein
MARFFSISYWVTFFSPASSSPAPIIDWVIKDHEAEETRFARRRSTLPTA